MKKLPENVKNYIIIYKAYIIYITLIDSIYTFNQGRRSPSPHSKIKQSLLLRYIDQTLSLSLKDYFLILFQIIKKNLVARSPDLTKILRYGSSKLVSEFKKTTTRTTSLTP